MPSIHANYRSDRPFRTLLFLYRNDWGNIVLSMGLYVIKHSPEWLRPLILANVIDIIAQPAQHSLTELILNGVVLAAAIAQNLPTHYLHIRYMSRATRRMEAELRYAIAQHLQRLSLEFLMNNHTGILQSKLLTDVDAIQKLTTHLFQYIPAASFTITAALIMTALRAPWFLVFFAATVPIAALVMHSLRQPLRQRNRVLRKEFERLSAQLIEMLKMMPVTRAHGAEETQLQRTEQQISAVRHSALRVDSINAIANASSWVTLRLFACLCLITAAVIAFQGQLGMTAGDVVLLTGLFDALTQAVVRFLNVLPQITKGFESISSIGEILESSELEPNQGKKHLHHIIGAFEFKQMSYTYGSQTDFAIQDFSLTVQAGETIAFVGPSGAGKSTLLNLIIGFLRPTRGSIELDGQDLSQVDLRTYRQFIAVVSQETILFEGTVRENILYGTQDIEEDMLDQAIADANALEFIEALPQGLDTKIGENGVKLSGGQRQRLAIARALIRQPQVLILDEATASLDTLSEQLIQQALDRLMENRTTFIVAHRLSTVRKADRIVVLEKGKIVECGNQAQLLNNPNLFAQLYRSQALSHR